MAEQQIKCVALGPEGLSPCQEGVTIGSEREDAPLCVACSGAADALRTKLEWSRTCASCKTAVEIDTRVCCRGCWRSWHEDCLEAQPAHGEIPNCSWCRKYPRFSENTARCIDQRVFIWVGPGDITVAARTHPAAMEAMREVLGQVGGGGGGLEASAIRITHPQPVFVATSRVAIPPPVQDRRGTVAAAAQSAEAQPGAGGGVAGGGGAGGRGVGGRGGGGDEGEGVVAAELRKLLESDSPGTSAGEKNSRKRKGSRDLRMSASSDNDSSESGEDSELEKREKKKASRREGSADPTASASDSGMYGWDPKQRKAIAKTLKDNAYFNGFKLDLGIGWSPAIVKYREHLRLAAAGACTSAVGYRMQQSREVTDSETVWPPDPGFPALEAITRFVTTARARMAELSQASVVKSYDDVLKILSHPSRERWPNLQLGRWLVAVVELGLEANGGGPTQGMSMQAYTDPAFQSTVDFHIARIFQPPPPSPTQRCFHCHEPGHIKANCPKRFSGEGQKTGTSGTRQGVIANHLRMMRARGRLGGGRPGGRGQSRGGGDRDGAGGAAGGGESAAGRGDGTGAGGP
jgi:hypothetical protein